MSRKERHLSFFQSRNKSSKEFYEHSKILKIKEKPSVVVDQNDEEITSSEDEVVAPAKQDKKVMISADRAAFLRQNEDEKVKLDREIVELERKLGIKTCDRKRRKLNSAIEQEGYGTGFMKFIDGIKSKVNDTAY